jgi:hypothetical protein
MARPDFGTELDAIVNTLCVLRCAVVGSHDETDRAEIGLMMLDVIDRVKALPATLEPAKESV